MQLLERGDKVIAAVRSPDKAPLLQPLHEQHGDQLLVVKLDTSDAASIKASYLIHPLTCMPASWSMALVFLGLPQLVLSWVSPAMQEAASMVAGKVPHLDVLINNAGIATSCPSGRISEEEEEHMIQTFQVNLLGPMLTTQAFLPLLHEGRQRKVRPLRRAVHIKLW